MDRRSSNTADFSAVPPNLANRLEALAPADHRSADGPLSMAAGPGFQATGPGRGHSDPDDYRKPRKLRSGGDPSQSDGILLGHSEDLSGLIKIGSEDSNGQVPKALHPEDQSVLIRRNGTLEEVDIRLAALLRHQRDAGCSEPEIRNPEKSVPAILDPDADGNAIVSFLVKQVLIEHPEAVRLREHTRHSAPASNRASRLRDAGENPVPPGPLRPGGLEPPRRPEEAGNPAPWSLMVATDPKGGEEAAQEFVQGVADWIATVYRAAFPIVHVTLSVDDGPPGWPHPKGVLWVDAMSLHPYANYGFAAAAALADLSRLEGPVLADRLAVPRARATGVADEEVRPVHRLFARGELVGNHRLLRLRHQFGPPRPDVSFADRKPF